MKTFATLCAALGLVLAPGQGRPPLTVTVDGRPVQFADAPPQVIAGRTMVPLRGVFESIGAMVEYKPPERQIKINRNDEVIELRVGDRLAKRNGAEILLDVAPRIRGRSTLVPLRFIVESLGAVVNFDRGNNRVEILLKG